MSRRRRDPLRSLTDDERQELTGLSRSRAAPAVRVAWAVILLAVADGSDSQEAAWAAGRTSGDAVSHLVARFNREGLAAPDPRRGPQTDPRRVRPGSHPAGGHPHPDPGRRRHRHPVALPPPAGSAGRPRRDADRLHVHRLGVLRGAGYTSLALALWLLAHGVMPLYTPLGRSWRNMAESIQRVLKRRALDGEHPASPGEIIARFGSVARYWNAAPTPFVWGGKRAARRTRERERCHAVGGSGAYTRYPVRRRYGHDRGN